MPKENDRESCTDLLNPEVMHITSAYNHSVVRTKVTWSPLMAKGMRDYDSINLKGEENKTEVSIGSLYRTP